MNVWSLEATCIAHSMRRVLLAARDPDRFLDDKDYYGNKGTLSRWRRTRQLLGHVALTRK